MLKLCTVTHGYFSTSQDESGMHPTKHPNTKSAAGSLPSPLSFKRKTDASWYRSSLACIVVQFLSCFRRSCHDNQGFSQFLSGILTLSFVEVSPPPAEAGELL
ncbi:hypothetical protein RchiOBHm_MTg0499061 (mitochondrion) [Rosa chinensis]|uniref:Uncharacterized protein n=1 Tax=Rosa chinensis TaxID=74649 RepID=A0A2P6P160_ROSCH|nr:hypothetical protein RchiOBHm_MTg0499061 [Rosa chinensis]